MLSPTKPISSEKETFLPQNTMRQIANILTVLLALAVNILASTLPLNGQNTGEISDRFQVFP